MEILHFNGRETAIHTKGRGGPVLVHLVDERAEAECRRMAELIGRYAPGRPFTLVTVGSSDWSGDYSPWPAQVSDWGDFAGRGGETLSLLKEAVLPKADPEGTAVRALGGYSLAGLCALWAFYETGLFTGCAACSASLWFPGWLDYAGEHPAPVGSVLYLSLGKKEPQTRHPVLSTIGDCLARQTAIAEADPNVRAVESVWNPGNHGTEADVRMARGFAWLLERLSET